MIERVALTELASSGALLTARSEHLMFNGDSQDGAAEGPAM